MCKMTFPLLFCRIITRFPSHILFTARNNRCCLHFFYATPVFVRPWLTEVNKSPSSKAQKLKKKLKNPKTTLENKRGNEICLFFLAGCVDGDGSVNNRKQNKTKNNNNKNNNKKTKNKKQKKEKERKEDPQRIPVPTLGLRKIFV